MGSRKLRIALLTAALMVVPGMTNTATASPEAGAAQIVADLGVGWNLGNQLEANSNGYPSETAWGNPAITQALIDKVKAAGFKSIRIPVSYLRTIGAGPNYTLDAAWLNRIQQVVNYAYNRGLYVIINMHGDGYKSIPYAWLICDAANQTEIRAKYLKVWQQIATRFQSYDNRLILESMNENFDGQYGAPTQPCYSNINAWNQIFVDTVRRAGGNNSSRWLLVPGWNTNIDYTAGNYGFVVPTDQYRSSSIPANEQRLMISVHYYSPWDFAGEENGTITQWGRGATNPARKSTWGQEDYLDAQLKLMYDKFVVRGYPVVVGEYGSIDKTSADSTNNRYRADYARAVVSTSKKYGAATVYWDNGHNGQYGFGLFNRANNAVTQQGIIDAIKNAR
ncbi:glycoside hydrolase family 5 protein [Kribbella yunnanensis]|uniref:Glycoside hydrolase family 5 protein n=1 Tax=Kribbella yunnanensis TaxID=190194 RepID=A0ABN2IEQ7_9ACTN